MSAPITLKRTMIEKIDGHDFYVYADEQGRHIKFGTDDRGLFTWQVLRNDFRSEPFAERVIESFVTAALQSRGGVEQFKVGTAELMVEA